VYYKTYLLWADHPLHPSIVGQIGLPGFNCQIKSSFNQTIYTKGVIRRRKSQKDRQYNVQIKTTKGQTTIYKTGKTKHRATTIPLNTGVILKPALYYVI
jgi:hypothetical protein